MLLKPLPWQLLLSLPCYLRLNAPWEPQLSKMDWGEASIFFSYFLKKKIYLLLFISQNYLLRIPDHLDVWVDLAFCILTLRERKRSQLRDCSWFRSSIILNTTANILGYKHAFLNIIIGGDKWVSDTWKNTFVPNNKRLRNKPLKTWIFSSFH